MAAVSSFQIPYKEIKRVIDEYGTPKKLGSGGFGTVYLSNWQHAEVAVKELINQAFCKESEKEFERETQIMRDLRHPNVVLLYGTCMEPNRCLVMEYCAQGALHGFLQNKEPLEWSQRISWILDIAKGLSYLHGKQILHRDLKSPNILIDKNLTPKITDFGLSQVKLNSKTFTSLHGRIGTLYWMAPEVMGADSEEQNSYVYTQAADIYSYAMIVWELAAWQMPYKGLGEATVIRRVLLEGRREEIPPKVPSLLQTVITECWKQKPEERLLLADAIKTLDACQKSLSIPSPSISASHVTSLHLVNPPSPVPSPKISQSLRSKPTNELKPKESDLASENSIPNIFPAESGKLPAMAFGAAKWEKYFGSVGAEPPLPADIDQILSNTCPFWSGFWSKKKISETHILVLIPQTVNGRRLTLDTLQELVKSPKEGGHATQYRYYWDDAQREMGDQLAAPFPYWILMTRDVLPNSRRMTYSEQRALIKKPYMVPGALEIATGILMHYVETGERLYSESPKTYTRCQEVCSRKWRLEVGLFGPSGLSVNYFGDADKNFDCGLGLLQKF